MAGGRPTLYSQEYLDKTKIYIDSCEDTKDTVNLPTIEGLAYELKVNKSTIYLWRKEHEEFSDFIEELLSKQARQLVNNGLIGRYNSTIAKVLLTKHGYREGQDITSNDEKIQSGVIILPQKNESALETTTEANPSTD